MDDAFLGSLAAVCGALDALNLPYALTGSVVSSVYGEPYTSQGVDICLRMSVPAAKALAAALPPRFYRSEEAMLEAARSRQMANLIDMTTGLKVDLSVLADEPYHDSVFARRWQMAYSEGGPAFWTVSPEDIVLMKLRGRKDSWSQKQWDNDLSVVRVQGAKLDWGYLREWAGRLDLAADLDAVQREAGV